MRNFPLQSRTNRNLGSRDSLRPTPSFQLFSRTRLTVRQLFSLISVMPQGQRQPFVIHDYDHDTTSTVKARAGFILMAYGVFEHQTSSLDGDHLNLVDLISGEGHLFGLKVFDHMLLARGSG